MRLVTDAFHFRAENQTALSHTLLAVAIARLLAAGLVGIVAVAVRLGAVLREGGIGGRLERRLFLWSRTVAAPSAVLEGIICRRICGKAIMSSMNITG